MVRTTPSFFHSVLPALLNTKKVGMNRNNVPRPERPLQSLARPEGLQTGFIRTHIGASACPFPARIPNNQFIGIQDESGQIFLVPPGIAGYACPYRYVPFSSTHLQFSMFRVPDRPPQGYPPPERFPAILLLSPLLLRPAPPLPLPASLFQMPLHHAAR